jgi:hypothetical protein
VKFPIGGIVREHDVFKLTLKAVCRIGAIPIPTVKVWMEEDYWLNESWASVVA